MTTLTHSTRHEPTMAPPPVANESIVRVVVPSVLPATPTEVASLRQTTSGANYPVASILAMSTVHRAFPLVVKSPPAVLPVSAEVTTIYLLACPLPTLPKAPSRHLWTLMMPAHHRLQVKGQPPRKKAKTTVPPRRAPASSQSAQSVAIIMCSFPS